MIKSPMTEILKDPELSIRRNARSQFIWELLCDDGHVVNRSDDEFHTMEDCRADAEAHGHS